LIPGIAGSCSQLLIAAQELFVGVTLLPFDHRLAGPEATIEDLANQAAACIPEGECIYICGESFGGPIALTLARHHPDRVRGLVLLSTFAHHPSPRQLHARVLIEVWSTLTQRGPLLAHAARIAAAPGQFGRVVPLKTLATYLNEPLLTSSEYRRRIELLASFDARPWLREITAPSLVLLGRRDPIVPAHVARELGSLLPNCTVHELSCGHLGYLAVPMAIRRQFEIWREELEISEAARC